MKTTLKAVCLLTTLALLAGCSGDKEKKLEGERISVLAFDNGVEADPSLASTPMHLAQPLLNSNWPTSGGRIDHGGGNFAVSEKPKRVWRESVGDGIDSDQPLMAGPVVDGGLVFTMDSGTRVTATQLENGKRLWKSDLAAKGERGGATGGGLSLANGIVYAATGYGEVVALKADNGTELWRQRLDAPLRSAPTVADGRVYVVSIDNQLLALDAATGQKLWDHQGFVEAAGLLGAASPAVGAGLVLAAYSSGEVYALWAENGRPLWSDSLAPLRRTSSLASIAAVRGLPVLAANGAVALAIGNAGRMVAIDVRSGQRAWEQKLGGNQMPWVSGDTVFVISSSAQLVALSLRDGRVRWVQQLAAFDDPKNHEDPIVWSGPVLAGGKLWLVNNEGDLKGYSPLDGHEEIKLDLGHGATRAPVVANGTLLVLDDSATLSAWR